MRRFTTAATFAGALAMGLSTPASAQEDPADDLELTAAQRADLDARATETLQNSKPGGKRIAPDKIAWDDGDVVLTLAIDGKARDTAPAKQNGKVYLFDGMNGGGDELAFYECKFEKLRHYNFTNRTSSWFNNQYGWTLSELFYWDGSSVEWLDGSRSPDERNLPPAKDNRADFIQVC